MKSSLIPGLPRGAQCKLRIERGGGVHLWIVQECAVIKVGFHLGGERSWKCGGLEMRDGRHAAFGIHEALPHTVDRVAKTGDPTHARDNHAWLAHEILRRTMAAFCPPKLVVVTTMVFNTASRAPMLAPSTPPTLSPALPP